jgi:hypothetical protein
MQRASSFTRLRQTAGQSLVEAAFALPLLLILTFGIIDFSWALFSHLALQNGVSEAARYGITGATMPGMNRAESIRAAMRNATPILQIQDQDFSFSRLVGNNWVAGLGGPGEIEKVTVTYVHEVLVFRPLFPNGQVTLRAESAMKNEGRFN